MNTIGKINENGVFNINNISYSFEEYGVEFRFTYRNEGFKSAILQLPNTPDSQHVIDDQEFDGENSYHLEVYETLRDSYYADFKDIECAKASIIALERVIHVEAAGNLYVAFCESGKTIVLQEGRAASYYNVFYFEPADYEIDQESTTELAKKYFFKSLVIDLEKKLSDEIDAAGCDSETNFFMQNQFGEWEESEVAKEFYENFACDIRRDAQVNLVTAE